MQTDGFESLILFVEDLAAARAFYVDGLRLPLLFDDEIIAVVGGPSGRVVLHRNDKGHDERGIFPAGNGVGGAAVRFTVEDPDACEREATERGFTGLVDYPGGRLGSVRRACGPRRSLGGPRQDEDSGVEDQPSWIGRVRPPWPDDHAPPKSLTAGLPGRSS